MSRVTCCSVSRVFFETAEAAWLWAFAFAEAAEDPLAFAFATMARKWEIGGRHRQKT